MQFLTDRELIWDLLLNKMDQSRNGEWKNEESIREKSVLFLILFYLEETGSSCRKG